MAHVRTSTEKFRIVTLIFGEVSVQCFVFNTLKTGDEDLRFLHYKCARRMTQICVFNKRLFSLHNTLNYAIRRARLRMVLLTDVYRKPTSL